jgi:hypothetical protein
MNWRRGLTLGTAKLNLGSVKHIQSGFNIFFDRTGDVTEFAAPISELLNTHYMRAQVLEPPPGIEGDFPRLALGSRHGSSNILISSSNVALRVQYSRPWQSDFSKGRAYLEERVPLLVSALKPIGSQIMFMGMDSQFRMEVGDTEHDKLLVRWLADRYATGLVSGIPHEIHLRLANILDDKYFSNVTVRNYRQWQSISPHFSGMPRLTTSQADETGLEVSLDLNDRFAYNEVSDYQTKEEDWRDLMQKFVSVYSTLVEETKGGI